MSAITTTTRGGTCAICLEEFLPSDQQFTHKGGEGHDGFHKPCLIDVLLHDGNCPIDQQPIDRSSLISRTALIRARLNPALVNATRAAYIATTLASIERVKETGINRIITSLEITEAPAIVATRLATAAIAVTLVLVAINTARAWPVAIENAEAWPVVRAAAVNAAVVAFAGAALAETVTAGTRREDMAQAALIITATGIVGGIGTNPNVRYGLIMGGCTSLAFLELYKGQIPTIGPSIIAAVAAGIFSLLRG